MSSSEAKIRELQFLK